MSEIFQVDHIQPRRKRASSDVLRDEEGRPFHGENWRKFVYHPLDSERKEIRLLLLYPSPRLEDDIRCVLIVWELGLNYAEYEPFDAISYVWGNQSNKTFIELNGVRVKIGTTAHRALRDTRLPDQPRLVWIDSLCINQVDVSERNQQITLMREIFSKASEVLLCVCDPWRFAFAATEKLKTAALVGNYLNKDLETRALLQSRNPSMLAQVQEVEQMNYEDWRTILEFLGLSFWRRLWIVQEITLGSLRGRDRAIILIGRFRIQYLWIAFGIAHVIEKPPAETSRGRWLNLRDVQKFPNYVQMAPGFTAQLAESPARDYSFFIMIQAGLDVFNDKDRIYGLLALLPKLEIQIDYRKSTEQVYEDATAAMFDTSDSLECMLLRKNSESEKDALASWSLDFRRCPASIESSGWAPQLYQYYSAAGIANLKSPLRRHGRLVCVQGKSVSQFETAPALGPPNLLEDLKIQEWYERMDQMIVFTHKLLARHDKIAVRQNMECGRFLFLDMAQHDEGKPYLRASRMNPSRHFQSFDDDSKPYPHTWVESYLRTSDNHRTFQTQVQRLEYGIWTWRDFVTRMLHNTRIAMDSGGHLCVVPAATQVGDVIYLLASSTVPFVLRPVADAKRSLFKVVGPAYVHGIMDGELVFDSPKRVSTGDPDAYDAAFNDIWLC